MGGSDVIPSLSLRLALAGAWQAVRGRSLGHFPRVLGLLEAVGRAAPDALSFRHGARLRLGLRAAVVVQMLREAQPEGKVFDAIDSFFPEGDPGEPLPPQASPQEAAMVAEAQESFREMALGLLGDPGRRERYLRFQASQEYGELFLGALERLFHEFLERLESCLPPPDVTKLYDVIWSHAPPGPRPAHLPALTRYLQDVGHAHVDTVPRPLPGSRKQATPTRPAHFRVKPRPPQRRPRPPLEFLGDVSSDSEEEAPPPRKARSLPPARRAPPTSDADGEGNRDRHRTHRQGGADQGAGGGEGGDPPPAAATHLQRQADERREDGGRLQDPGRLRPPSCPGPARGRGLELRGRGQAQDTPLRPLLRPRPR